MRAGHGSVGALADTYGNVTNIYEYDPFGNSLHFDWAMPTATLGPADRCSARLRKVLKSSATADHLIPIAFSNAAFLSF